MNPGTDTVHPPLFNYPPRATVGHPLHKSKIYRHARPPQLIQNLFIDQIQQITWSHKLAPETINLPARRPTQEIQIFRVLLKAPELDARVLETIDKAIAHPILFELEFDNRIKPIAALKRPSEANAGQQVVEHYFSGGWLSANSQRNKLPVALDLHGLYLELLRAHLPIKARPGESLQEQIVRLEARLNRERQFNRKVALNGELRELREKLTALLSIDTEQN